MRDTTLRDFRSGRTPVLVATNVAARGLDVDDVKVVINYDYPASSEDYVHRIGRTGRRDRTGTAYTVFTEEDAKGARDLIKVMNEASQEVPQELQELQELYIAGRARERQQKSRGYSMRSRRDYRDDYSYRRDRYWDAEGVETWRSLLSIQCLQHLLSHELKYNKESNL